MYAFGQIEKFLEKEIKKNPLPENLGKGPEYVTDRKSNPRGRGNGHGRKSGRHGHGNAAKASANEKQGDKRRRPRRRGRRKPGKDSEGK